VTVPSGALPSGTTVSVYPVTGASALSSSVPSGQTYVASFAVSWESPTGSSPAASTAITMTITDPAIRAGDTVYEMSSSGLKAVGTATVGGVATVTFVNDPTFVLAAVPEIAITTTHTTRSGQVIPVKVKCSIARCTGTIDIKTTVVIKSKKHASRTVLVLLGSAHYRMAAGRQATVRVGLNARGRQTLDERTLRESVIVTVTGGRTATRRLLA
jgi:hypothetical protein